MSTYIGSIKGKLGDLHVDIGVFSSAIDIINEDMRQISAILPSEFTIEEKLSELYEFALSTQIENSLQDVCYNTTFYFTSMYQEVIDSPSVRGNIVDRTAYNIVFHIVSFLIDL
mgnify:CR=1 FL=1